MITDNPFRDSIADAWSDPIDLATIHADVTDDLVRRVDELSAQSRAGGPPSRSQCVLLLGPAGSGKTHLFARLRKKLGFRAVFFYTRPELGAQATPRYLLAQLMDSLRLPVPGSDRTQLDLVAATMLSATLGHPTRYPLTFLSSGHDDPEGLVQRAIDEAERRYPHILPSYLERLLSAPFLPGAQARRAAVTWLSGRPPNEAELARIGESRGLGDEDILPALRTLGFAATFGAPIVVVLDQLENLADDDPAHARMVAHAQLVAELSDTVPGMLVVQMALDSEWMRYIRPGLPRQLLDRIQKEVAYLSLPTPEQARQLVEVYLDRLPAEERKGPFPWPLDPAAVERWTREAMTPRALIQRCKAAFDGFLGGQSGGALGRFAAQTPGTLDDRLKLLHAGFLEKARAEIERAAGDEHHLDAERIASGLLAVSPLLGTPARRVVARRDRPEVMIATTPETLVLIAQQNHHTALGALLTDAAKTEGSRVAVVREASFEVPATWKLTHAQIAALRERQNSMYSTVGAGELSEWLAAEGMSSAARSRDLNDDIGRVIEPPVVAEWLRRHLAEGALPVARGLLAAWQRRPEVASVDTAPGAGKAGGKRAAAAPERASGKPVAAAPERAAVKPSAPSKAASRAARRADPAAAIEAEELEKLVLGQLLKLNVSVTVTARVVGARLIRLEVSAPRQRVGDLDKAAADIEHKLADRGARFEREGARRYFTAPRIEPREVMLEDLLAREEGWLRERPGRFVIGESIDGEVVRGDLSDGGSCHLLVAGQTGSGKSVLLRAIVAGLARFHPPSRIRFTLGDPKRVTFGPIAAALPDHVIAPVSQDAESIVLRLEALEGEMTARYDRLHERRVDDIHQYNRVSPDKLPLEVVVIDEFADLVLDRVYKQTFLNTVKRIGNMGRAAGVHLLLATQRPDKSTVPGEIKANLVGKIALKVQSVIDSRIILDEAGAEKLLGKGDMLVNVGHGVVRAQAPVLAGGG